MKEDAKVCPSERTVLKEFYDFAKGQEWTDSKNWAAEYVDCCDWEGVTCDETGKVEVLNLTDNGLSGKLSSSIGDLHALKVLDLSDNDIKVRNESATAWDFQRKSCCFHNSPTYSV